MLHYASAKAALATYTKGLAAEAGPHSVRVNAVTPGNAALTGGAVSGVICIEFSISRPGVSGHLKVLRGNGFALVRVDGQRRI
jgi:NAD(P)-dependent dehydrogenase (short-subunit alcohol dehydrogenase family)